MNKVKQELYRIRKEIYDEYYSWYISEVSIVDLKTLCPPEKFEYCRAEFTSWDGTTRNDDYMCTPATNFTDYDIQCPNTKCWDGQAPNPVDCSCVPDPDWARKVTEEEL